MQHTNLGCFRRPLTVPSLIYQNKLPNCPGKSQVGLIVDFPPNAATPPHRHAGASVSAYVLKGTIINKMNDEPTRVIEAGGTFFEAPGCHHKISDNYSNSEPAQLLVSLVVDTEVLEKGGPAALTVIDPEYRDILG
ncbi:uncharacterized protein N7515_006309 [Penicillium bovifimosum]|uniref:Cupin type-2 domain-containing protein n=1 Tax=Penicillium bovifimosum TaxID=126998 RepID=A0A9W9GUD3_9EURO|nr:uncharacterized protein N7515_006309 [Penicillium bovifimosum]KAJ5130270.1 hypothetical protein N7515_006309 [Penicillium bovifimosum]